MNAPLRKNQGLYSLLALVAAAVLFVAVNILAGSWTQRLDLTEQKLYTLSPGSKSVLRQIDEPITVRFYYSDRLGREVPAYGTYATRVRELLDEYVAISGNKIRVEQLNPLPFSDEEDRAVAFGLQGVPITQGGEQVYFGLAATNSTDDEQVIPFLQPERERFLEYDLTKLVYNLANPKKKVVALISDLPLEGDVMAMRMTGRPPQPWAIMEQLRGFFEMRQMGGDIAEIGDDVAVVMVAHPKKLSKQTQYAIDQFVLRGGRAIVFADPNSEAERARPNPMTGPVEDASSNLDDIFKAWGVEMVKGKVLGDRFSARRVNAGGSSRIQAVDYVAWLTLRPANFDTSDPITAELKLLNLATTGILRKVEGGTTEVKPLIQSSPASMEIDVTEFMAPVPDVLGLLNRFKPQNKREIIAARVQGPVKTAFPDGPPKKDAPKPASDSAEDKKKAEEDAKKIDEDHAKAMEKHLAQSKQPINVIVVADTDLLDDRFWVSSQDFFGQRLQVPSANNADFVANAIENLTGSNDLIGLRSRGTSSRPFEVVDELQRDAESQFRAKEKELQDKLKDVEKKLADIRNQGQGQGAQVILTAEQQRSIDQFRTEMVATRKELRDVQLALRKDIDRLQGWVQFLNIGLIPIVVAVFAILLGLWRRSRRRRGRSQTATARA
ncbi:MAG: Gldg family protein [Alphaproteobacteria bacterium]|nr:Gldg family protein [Alphaproteobacteria bacterium]